MTWAVGTWARGTWAAGTWAGDTGAARGDDGGGGKRPVIHYTPRKKLEKVLELVEDIPTDTRTSTKRKAVKQAREAFKDIELNDYGPSAKAISEALNRASRAAGEYEAFQNALSMLYRNIEKLLEEMEAKRLKRRREEEALITWLFN